MARIRNVKPELFRHGELFDLEVKFSLPLRLAFIGLWCQCDREGRFLWSPRRLKIDVLPYDDLDFESVLSALASGGFVSKYSVDGIAYGCVPAFLDHQLVSRSEPPSAIPGPDGLVSDFIAAPSNRIRFEIYERDGFRCAYCKCDMSDDEKDGRRRCLDHVIPLAHRGSNHKTNFVLSCKKCNAIKGARTPDQCGMPWPTDNEGVKYGHSQHPVNPPVNPTSVGKDSDVGQQTKDEDNKKFARTPKIKRIDDQIAPPSALVAGKPRRSTAKPIEDRPLGLTPKDVLTAWDARWLRIRGGPYVRTSGAKEGALASKLLKASQAAGIDKAGLGEAMDRFFADPYWAEKAATFAAFTAAAPGMFQRPPPKAPAMSRLHIEFMEAERQDARDRESQLRLTGGNEDSTGIVDVSAVGFPCS